MRLCQSSAGNYVVEHSRLGQAKNDELLQHTNYEYRKCMWAAMNDGGPTSNDLSMDLLNEIILKMERRRLADSTANTKIWQQHMDLFCASHSQAFCSSTGTCWTMGGRCSC